MDKQISESLTRDVGDPLIRVLNRIVVLAVKFLAILMVIVILWSLVDVCMHLYRSMTSTFAVTFDADNLISMLGSFLVVLIAIEIFLNIIFYLKRDAVHVPLVLATALTAIARKVILFDFNFISPQYIYATAAVIFALGLSYWLVTKQTATSETTNGNKIKT